MGEFHEGDKEKQYVIELANRQLGHIGLSVNDLSYYKSIFDIGAKDCFIQRSAEYYGYNNVVSVDRHFPKPIKQVMPGVIEADVRNLNVSESSADLVIVNSSAYYYTKTANETLAILDSLNRILQRRGEQRIFPARFGHILFELANEDSNFFNARAKAPALRSKADMSRIRQGEEVINQRSLNFLRQHGIPYNINLGLSSGQRQEDNIYLSIPKF